MESLEDSVLVFPSIFIDAKVIILQMIILLNVIHVIR